MLELPRYTKICQDSRFSWIPNIFEAAKNCKGPANGCSTTRRPCLEAQGWSGTVTAVQWSKGKQMDP